MQWAKGLIGAKKAPKTALGDNINFQQNIARTQTHSPAEQQNWTSSMGLDSKQVSNQLQNPVGGLKGKDLLGANQAKNQREHKHYWGAANQNLKNLKKTQPRSLSDIYPQDPRAIK